MQETQKSIQQDLFTQAHERRSERQFNDAVACYQEILRNDPSNVQALYEWADMACGNGNIKKALQLLQRARAAEPENPDILSRLGGIYAKQGQYEPALALLNKALALHPNHASACSNTALVCLEQGDPWQAEKLCLQGLKQHKSYEPLYTILGNALRAQGRSDEALSPFKESCKLAVKNPDAWQNLAVTYMDMGERENAEKALEKALDCAPDHVVNNYMYALAHRYRDKNDPHIHVLQDLLSRHQKALDKFNGPTPPEMLLRKIVHIHFALGQAFHSLKDYDSSFEHYRAGNDLMARISGYDTKLTERNFSAVKSAFSEQNTASKALPADLYDVTPIFIVGLPRSGTSLTEQILSAHPLVSGGGELPYLKSVQYNNKHLLRLAHYKNDLDALSKEQIREMADSYIEQLKRHAPEGTRFITDKMPLNFRFIGLIKLMFPNAKIVHCKRDPRDAGLSMYRHLFNVGHPFIHNLRNLGLYYEAYDDLMSFWKNLYGEDIFDMEYERLIEHQEDVTRSLIDYCGLPWDTNCLSFHDSTRAVKTASNFQVRKPLYKTSVGAWKNYEKHLKPLLETLEEKGNNTQQRENA